MRFLGFLVAVVGVIGLVTAMNFDPSVSTEFGRVNNIGLMSEKQNYIMISIGVTAIGVVIFLAGLFTRSSVTTRTGATSASGPVTAAKWEVRKCPFCAETIKAEATKCRFCSSGVEPTAMACAWCDQAVPVSGLSCANTQEGKLREVAPTVANKVCQRELAKRGYLQPSV